MGRGGHEELPGTNGVEFHRTILSEFALEFWAQMGKNFKWYGIFEVFTIYNSFLKFWKFVTHFL